MSNFLDMLKLNLREHKELALHIHPILQIEIVGNNLTIPAEVGISDLGMRVIHTHDTTGKLHAEAPSPFQFHLDDFFEIWGKNLNSTCIFDLCENEKFSLKIYVNGVEVNKSERIPLFDKDLIKIVYS